MLDFLDARVPYICKFPRFWNSFVSDKLQRTMQSYIRAVAPKATPVQPFSVILEKMKIDMVP
jgi:hypothetical protein